MDVLLIENADVVVTMDAQWREIPRGSVVVRGREIECVGWPGFESAADRFSAREALELATLGGAAVLGRDDIGSLEAGKAADLVVYRVDGLQHAGAVADPVAALVTCASVNAWLSLINGRIVVEQGRIPGLDLDALVHQHNRLAAALLERAAARGTP